MKKRTLSTFEQTLVDCVLEEFKDVPAEDQIDMTFSPAFEAKAQELIRKSERNHWSSGKVFLRKVAIVALISAMLLLTACAVRLIWENIIEFEFFDDGRGYHFYYDEEDIANAPDYIETVYHPTYIPKGYQEVLRDYGHGLSTIAWMNDEEKYISFLQLVLPDDPGLDYRSSFSSTDSETEWITINQCQVLRIEDWYSISYVWVTNEYEFNIICPKPLSDEEMIRIFDSIRIDEDAVVFGVE